MTRDHTTIEELLAVRSLGGLDGEDVHALDRMLADHGDCDECRALEATYADTAALLAASLDPVDVDPGMADRILAAPGGRPEAPSAPPRRGRAWAAIVAVAAVLVLVAGSLAVLRDRGPDPSVNWAQRVVAFDGATGEFAMAYV
ncbi:MAG TPA: hypothetical protein VE032_03165, partial [Actinomycetota bacterium]|nr:hypothetical protein [Actinomycetota bacterium]